MTTEHTPGPWRIVDREVMEDGSVYPCHILGGSADFQICTLESPQIAKLGVERPHHFPGLNGVLGPNARLIAAAPELLSALQDMLSGWKYIRESHGDLYGVGWDRAQDNAEAAIRKARGEK